MGSLVARSLLVLTLSFGQAASLLHALEHLGRPLGKSHAGSVRASSSTTPITATSTSSSAASEAEGGVIGSTNVDGRPCSLCTLLADGTALPGVCSGMSSCTIDAGTASVDGADAPTSIGTPHRSARGPPCFS